MTIERVKQAAWLRGMHFDGIKKYRNCVVGTAYEVFTPDGRGFISSDTLAGMYRMIMEYPKVVVIRNHEIEYNLWDRISDYNRKTGGTK